MGKISLVSTKYIVHAHIEIEGTVDRPDVIGAIFGQTEGLLGEGLELRELQRNGKIGRIEVNMTTKEGKSSGDIIIPSSVDKAETAVIAAALETIQRIGPCNSKVKVLSIEDVRVSKRTQVVERAKELLKNLTDSVLPDSQEITDEVSSSVREMDVIEYGKERLTAGPGILDSDEIIVVEGRADVINLLRNGFRNAIALNGTSVPQTVIELSKEKSITLFVDGDRGGDLIIKELLAVAEVDFITKAPDGKEVEEITKKEINKAIRSRVPADQYQQNSSSKPIQRRTYSRSDDREPRPRTRERPRERTFERQDRREFPKREFVRKPRIDSNELATYSKMLEELTGSKGAYILDENNNILGKVPTSELQTTIRSLRTGIHAIILDGVIEQDLLATAERARIKYLVANESNARSNYSKTNIIVKGDLEAKEI